MKIALSFALPGSQMEFSVTNRIFKSVASVAILILASAPISALAEPDASSQAATDAKYAAAFKKFSETPQIAAMLAEAYGYALFPTVGKGGLGIGGAYGKGQVYKGGKVTGETKLMKVTIGLQAGGQGFSEMIFFEDKRAYDAFTSGEFEFDATASAVAITAGAQAKAGTEGTTAGASAGSDQPGLEE